MKKFILSLLLGFIGLISFSNAGFGITPSTSAYGVMNDGGTFSLSSGDCIDIFNSSQCRSSEIYNSNDELLYSTTSRFIYCMSENGYFKNNSSYNCQINVYSNLMSNCPVCEECETCPEVDTGAILSGYIAIEDITTNYCVSNDLCPEMSGGNSAIYINDIRHESMPFINIRIPEEIERNYEYTGNNTQLDISVEGYGYDQEKMQNMINTQYYTPTSEEMSSLIGKIADFLPLIAIALLIVRIRRVLKKVFRF